jgi:monoamine oxidase
MINFFKNLFGSKPAEPAVEVPYKVEEPAPVATPVAEQATQAVVESIAPAKKAPAKKAPAKKAPAAKKPRTPKAAK